VKVFGFATDLCKNAPFFAVAKALKAITSEDLPEVTKEAFEDDTV
jgi:hypothetical protein